MLVCVLALSRARRLFIDQLILVYRVLQVYRVNGDLCFSSIRRGITGFYRCSYRFIMIDCDAGSSLSAFSQTESSCSASYHQRCQSQHSGLDYSIFARKSFRNFGIIGSNGGWSSWSSGNGSSFGIAGFILVRNKTQIGQISFKKWGGAHKSGI